jgi:microcystin-dependent protein
MVVRKLAILFLGLWPSLAFPVALDPFVGQIATFGFGFCPRGWAQTDGRLLQISENTALFSLLGTTYGGDGATTFALPLIEPFMTIDRRPMLVCIALQGVYPSRPDP